MFNIKNTDLSDEMIDNKVVLTDRMKPVVPWNEKEKEKEKEKEGNRESLIKPRTPAPTFSRRTLSKLNETRPKKKVVE